VRVIWVFCVELMVVLVELDDALVELVCFLGTYGVLGGT